MELGVLKIRQRRGREEEKRGSWQVGRTYYLFETIAAARRYLAPPPSSKKAKSSSGSKVASLLAKVIGPTMAHRLTPCTLPLWLVAVAALLRIAGAQLPDTDLGTCQVST